MALNPALTNGIKASTSEGFKSKDNEDIPNLAAALERKLGERQLPAVIVTHFPDEKKIIPEGNRKCVVCKFTITNNMLLEKYKKFINISNIFQCANKNQIGNCLLHNPMGEAQEAIRPFLLEM